MNTQAKIKPPETVYAKIAAVQSSLAKTGIAKGRKNQQQGYAFRGIDDVYSALAPLLAEHRLNILPRMLSREVVERKTAKGGVLFNVTVEAEFDFVSADDGSAHTVRTFGEAMDSADKATNKAMSAAYKYAAFMAFAIPTEGDNDADSTTHEVVQDGMPDAEWAAMVQLREASQVNVPAMLKHLGIQVPNDNLRLLNIEQYGRVMEAMKQKLAQRAKEESNAKAKESNLAEELGDAIVF